KKGVRGFGERLERAGTRDLASQYRQTRLVVPAPAAFHLRNGIYHAFETEYRGGNLVGHGAGTLEIRAVLAEGDHRHIRSGGLNTGRAAVVEHSVCSQDPG